MKPEDQRRFSPVSKMLKDSRRVTVRLLSRGDGEKLADFYASILREDYRFYHPHLLDREHALAKASRADDDANVILVGQTDDARIGGYAWYTWKPNDDHSVFGICLRRELQGCGMGRLLMERLFEIARELGPAKMTLTVLVANTHAVALYKRMGFHIVREGMCERRCGTPPEPQCWMERRMRPGPPSDP